MAGISKELIDKIKSAANINDVVAEFVPSLKVANNKGQGLCPVHNERTPSFHTNGLKNIFKCFGCGVGGDVFDFLKSAENMAFLQAVDWLARRYNIALEDALFKPKFEQRAAKSTEKEGDYGVEWEELTEDDIRIWFAKGIIRELYRPMDTAGRYGLEPLFKMMESPSGRWRRIKSYWRVRTNKHGSLMWYKSHSDEHYPIYGREETWTKQDEYSLQEKSGTFVKVYQPFSRQNRFSYLGRYQGEYLNGMKAARAAYDAKVAEKSDSMVSEISDKPMSEMDPEEVAAAYEKAKNAAANKHKLDALFLCSGERDAKNLEALALLAGKEGEWLPVWGNSEHFKLSPGMLTSIYQMAWKFYNIPDIDAPGLKAMHELCMSTGHSQEKYLDILNVMLPSTIRSTTAANGKRCKDLRDFLNLSTRFEFTRLLDDAMPYRFWKKTSTKRKDGSWAEDYEIDNTVLIFFLEQNGFKKYDMAPDGSEAADYIFIRIVDNMVQKVHPGQMRSFVMEFLKERMMPRLLRNMVIRSTYFTPNMLESMSVADIDFTSATATSQLMFFQNGTWEITAGGITRHAPGTLPKYVWSNKMVKHNVGITEQRPFYVEWDKDKGFSVSVTSSSLIMQFLRLTSAIHWRVEELGVHEPDGSIRRKKTTEEQAEEDQHLLNKLFSLGYLAHRHKFAFRPWFVYGMEYQETGEGKSSGGTGKSAFFYILQQFLNFSENSGDRNEESNKHRFGTVTKSTDVVYLDDMHEHFSWRAIYSHLTSGFTVNPKNEGMFTIPYKQSPKMCGTGNFAIRDVNGSTRRRILTVAFSDYFHAANELEGLAERTIYDALGKELFSDFTASDWNDFYNVMAECVRLYLWNPTGQRILPPMENIHYKNLRANIGEIFITWADTIFHPDNDNTDCYIPRELLQASYTEMLKKSNLSKLGLGAPQFKDKLQKYCELEGLELNPREVLIRHAKPKQKGTPRMMVWFNTEIKSCEAFYIRGLDEDGAEPAPLTTEKKIHLHGLPENEARRKAAEAAQGLAPADETEELPF